MPKGRYCGAVTNGFAIVLLVGVYFGLAFLTGSWFALLKGGSAIKGGVEAVQLHLEMGRSLWGG